MREIDSILEHMNAEHASDVHLSVGNPPIYRIYGELKQNGHPALTTDAIKMLIQQVMTPEQHKEWTENQDIDFSYELPGVARFRVNAFFEQEGPAAVFRNIPIKVMSIQELGLPAHIIKFAEYRKGLCLVTGPTGCGKSSTLAALIDYINSSRKEHIITIEDPIEFVHQNKSCLVTQREVGVHTQSFTAALRASLREDPDVVLVGEMRDLETIEMALTAAETGHLVLGTLHTTGAADTIDRIINVFPVNQQPQIRQVLSNVLIGVLSQNLIKRADGNGRVAALEIMVLTSGISNLIREGKTFQIPSMIQTGRKEGMQTMDSALLTLIQEGKITKDMAIQFAANKELFGVSRPAN